MKTVVVLSMLLCAAFAEMEEVMMKDEALPKDPVPVPRDADPEESGAPEARNLCPDDWFSYGARCFKFVKRSVSWHSAEEHCNSLGGHLASVTEPKEYSYLQWIAETAGQSNAWLGGFHLQDRWMWIDRKGFYYTNWYHEYTASSCPCLYLKSTAGWSNGKCNSNKHFICAKNPFNC